MPNAVPEKGELERLLFMIKECKTSAYEAFMTMQQTNWSIIRKWLSLIDRKCGTLFKIENVTSMIVYKDQRYLIMQILETIIDQAKSDVERKWTKYNKIDAQSIPTFKSENKMPISTETK